MQLRISLTSASKSGCHSAQFSIAPEVEESEVEVPVVEESVVEVSEVEESVVEVVEGSVVEVPVVELLPVVGSLVTGVVVELEVDGSEVDVVPESEPLPVGSTVVESVADELDEVDELDELEDESVPLAVVVEPPPQARSPHRVTEAGNVKRRSVRRMIARSLAGVSPKSRGNRSRGRAGRQLAAAAAGFREDDDRAKLRRWPATKTPRLAR
jgi:hypothetical protein